MAEDDVGAGIAGRNVAAGSSARRRGVVSRATPTTVGEELADIDRHAVLAGQLGVEAGSVGDVGDQPVRRLMSCWMIAISRALRLIGLGQRQGLDRAAQRGQRVLQLVRDVGGKAFDRLDAVVERIGHVAHRLARECRSRRGDG